MTKECYLDLKGFVREEEIKGNRPSVVLLECMSNLTANEMFEETGAGSGAFEAVKELSLIHISASPGRMSGKMRGSRY